MRARIESCRDAPDSTRVLEIVLTVPADFRFRAGQYLEIQLAANVSIPLSIASSPHRLPELHLHYRSTPGLIEARMLDEQLASGEDLSIAGPFGTVAVQTPLNTPLLIAAGGTGGAQAMGILDALLIEPPSEPVTLLWCGDEADDLYRSSWLKSLNRSWLTVECIVDASRDPGNLAMGWLRDHAAEFVRHRIVLSGSPGFVYTASDLLETAGIDRKQMASDVFAYAPRDVGGV